MKLINWTQYDHLVTTLADKIDFKKNQFDQIVAINRGGNVLGTMLSYKSHVPLTVVNKDQSIDYAGCVLIVDDLSDSGNTFLRVVANLRTHKFKTACIHVKEGTKFVPDFYAETVGKEWIVYPYEQIEEDIADRGAQDVRSTPI